MATGYESGAEENFEILLNLATLILTGNYDAILSLSCSPLQTTWLNCCQPRPQGLHAFQWGEGKREDPGDEVKIFSEDAIILVSTKNNNKDGGQSISQSMLFSWLLPSFKTRFIIVSASYDKYISEA